MTRLMSLMLVLAIAPAAGAETPMTGAEFDSYSRGRTFYYGEGGQAYGVEQYLDNRRVRWSFLDGDCADGHWYELGSMICFEYEADPDPGPQCWTFYKGAGGLVAHFEGDPNQTTLYEVQDATEPMICLGPKVGV